jgi:hypothetical protein
VLDELFWLEPVADGLVVHFVSAMIDDLLECAVERAYAELEYCLGSDRLLVTVAYSERWPDARLARMLDAEQQIWTAHLERAEDSILLRIPVEAYAAAGLDHSSRATWAHRGDTSFSIVIFAAGVQWPVHRLHSTAAGASGQAAS